jgi:chemosensory pili system protein ChpC
MSERVTEVYSLLVPLLDGRLIVPRTCVAEVVGYQLPAQVLGAPPWYLGSMAWAGKQIPLVSFEGLSGTPLPPPSARTRVVIFHALVGKLECGAFGVLAQGFPQLVRISGDMLRADLTYVRPARAPVLCRVRMLKDSPLVPDLEQLELAIAEETSATTG